MSSGLGLILVLGLLSAIGSGSASFSVLLGAAAAAPAARGARHRLRRDQRRRLVRAVRLRADRPETDPAAWDGPARCGPSRWRCLPRCRSWDWWRRADRLTTRAAKARRSAVRGALRDRSYLLLHAGFFTCGFHIAFLVTHLPGEVDLCGLPPTVASWSLAIIGLANIAGSLLAGAAVSRYRSKLALALMYGSRAVLILLYLAAPKTAGDLLLLRFRARLTWLSTVPPTAAHRRQALRHPLPRHALRADSAFASGRRASSAPGSAGSRSRAWAATSGCGTRTLRSPRSPRS